VTDIPVLNDGPAITWRPSLPDSLIVKSDLAATTVTGMQGSVEVRQSVMVGHIDSSRMKGFHSSSGGVTECSRPVTVPPNSMDLAESEIELVSGGAVRVSWDPGGEGDISPELVGNKMDHSIRLTGAGTTAEVDEEYLAATARLHFSRQPAKGIQKRDIAEICDTSRAESSLVQLWLHGRPICDLLGILGGHLVGSTTSSGTKSLITREDVRLWDTEAQIVVDEMSAFLGSPLEEDLVHLDVGLVEATTDSLNSIGMDATIQNSIAKLQWQGSPAEMIAQVLHDFDLLPTLLDVLGNGQRRFMVPHFTPNGGKGFRQSSSYKEGTAACNTALNTLAKEGRVLLFKRDGIPDEILATLHLNTIIRAVKHGNSLGRTCLNLSYTNGLKSPLSVNEGTDLGRSDAWYVPPNLPTLQSISGDIQKVRARFPGERICGGTADVNQAYCQNVASVESAKLRCTTMECEEIPGGVMAMYIVCIFGDTRAGHVYNIISRAIDHGHNRGLDIRRSSTYVDDGILYGTETSMEQSQSEYLDLIRLLFGEGAISQKKISPISQDLVAIGWHWNLRDDIWNVGPKRRALIKMYIAVFFMIKPSDTTDGAHRGIPRCVLLHVSSLLMWYCTALPMGRSFVMSILRCAGPEVSATGVRARARDEHFLSSMAKMDIEWWRALIVMALKHPHVMRVPIDLIAEGRAPDFLLQTDASTSIGGGGWLAPFGNQSAVIRSAVIRWTAEELRSFVSARTDINVLEFFTAAVLIMSWGDLLKGKKVLIRIDNMSAKKWLVTNRFTEGASWADSFMSLFSLYCTMMNIVIVTEHVPGVINIFADRLSRDLSMQESWCQEDTAEDVLSRIKSKGKLCRRFFMDCARTRSRTPLPSLLVVLGALLGMDGAGSA
jgi:hypothetical protein